MICSIGREAVATVFSLLSGFFVLCMLVISVKWLRTPDDRNLGTTSFGGRWQVVVFGVIIFAMLACGAVSEIVRADGVYFKGKLEIGLSGVALLSVIIAIIQAKRTGPR